MPAALSLDIITVQETSNNVYDLDVLLVFWRILMLRCIKHATIYAVMLITLNW